VPKNGHTTVEQTPVSFTSVIRDENVGVLHVTEARWAAAASIEAPYPRQALFSSMDSPQ
jgi:hypothetical protein